MPLIFCCEMQNLAPSIMHICCTHDMHQLWLPIVLLHVSS